MATLICDIRQTLDPKFLNNLEARAKLKQFNVNFWVTLQQLEIYD